ncbi:MAG TPA: hypothetical protein VHC43_11715 [Mycobacteriales bacterium]|nr:hypothetical protein [Mycobacteriales bacterium]
MPVNARLHVELEALSATPMDAATAVRLHALWEKVITHAHARQMIATHATVDAVRDGLLQPASNEEADMLAAQELACATHKTKKRWKVDQNPDGSETWTSHLGFSYTVRPRHFPLPDPLPLEDEPPQEIADRLPVTFDPDPPRDDDPLPSPPRPGFEEYEAMERALDELDAMGVSFREWCDKYYDEARATKLVA